MSLTDHAKEQAKGFGMKLVGGVVGLLSAGVLMWFTPFIDRYIKPPKPIANFETVEANDGLTVTFKSLSQNAKQAKWDFGDGSPLVIVPGTQVEVQHKYKKANSYPVTLYVTNVVDQEDKRSNTVAVGVKPQLLDVSVKAVQQKPPYLAPAKFRFIATADMEDSTFEWDFGRGSYEPGADKQEHVFNRPGEHTVRVRAVIGGARSTPQVKIINILPAHGVVTTGAVEPGTNPATVSARPSLPAATTLTVDILARATTAAENLGDSKNRMLNVRERATNSEWVQTISATPGFLIQSVQLEKATVKMSPNLINLSVITVDNGKAIQVKAQATKPGTEISLQGLVTYQEVRNATMPMEYSCTLSIPGNGRLDRPLGRKLEFEVRSNGKTILKQSDLPMVPVTFSLEGRNFLISTSTSQGEHLNVVVRETPRKLPF
jgi:PKD repeat protein